jgi:hypothetical protein
MKDLAEKLARLERTLSQEKGVFNLFALFLREDAPDVWDLVVAAKWIEADRPAALLEISKRVRAFLSADEITKIARVVVVQRTNPALKAITSAISLDQGVGEVANSTFFGLAIRHAFIITAQLDPPPNKVLQTAAAGGRRWCRD